jgi:hypothetical protein
MSMFDTIRDRLDELEASIAGIVKQNKRLTKRGLEDLNTENEALAGQVQELTAFGWEQQSELVKLREELRGKTSLKFIRIQNERDEALEEILGLKANHRDALAQLRGKTSVQVLRFQEERDDALEGNASLSYRMEESRELAKDRITEINLLKEELKVCHHNITKAQLAAMEEKQTNMGLRDQISLNAIKHNEWENIAKARLTKIRELNLEVQELATKLTSFEINSGNCTDCGGKGFINDNPFDDCPKGCRPDFPSSTKPAAPPKCETCGDTSRVDIGYEQIGDGEILPIEDACPDCPEPAALQTYPCAKCGVLRTEAEGGKVFTVCDECWDEPAAPQGKDAGFINARNAAINKLKAEHQERIKSHECTIVALMGQINKHDGDALMQTAEHKILITKMRGNKDKTISKLKKALRKKRKKITSLTDIIVAYITKTP